MPISERLMKPEQWSIPFIPEIPRYVLTLLQPYGHIVVTGSVVDPRQVADVDLRKTARFVGIVRNRLNPLTIGGPGLIAWLGDEEGKGDLWEANLVITAKTFVQSVTAALPLGTVTAGTISAIGVGTVTQSFFIANGQGSARVILDWLMTYFGGEYRVNNDITVDAGPSATLFPTTTTPTAIFVPWLAAVDPNIIGITASTLTNAIDADSQSVRVWFGGAGGSNAAANAPSPPGYKNLKGNTAVITRAITDTNTAAGNVGAMATANAAKYPLRQQVAMTSERYDIRRDVAAGDWIYVYDPENGLHDETNQVVFGGQAVFPTKLRVMALTWPVEAGMGVYYRDLNGVYTDLTQYVAWEPPGVTFEVGAANRTLTF